MTNEEHMEEAIKNIMEEMEVQVNQFEAEGKLIEAQRDSVNGQNTMSKCFVRWVTPMVSKTTHVTWMVVKKVSHRLILLDFFPEDFPHHD